MTSGSRSVRQAEYAEHQGAFGVVVNAPITDETITQIKHVVDIPVIATIISSEMDVAGRVRAGADILNISGAARTPEIVAKIRKDFPDIPIIATGGPTEEDILRTIQAGANAITYTPPSTGELFSRADAPVPRPVPSRIKGMTAAAFKLFLMLPFSPFQNQMVG